MQALKTQILNVFFFFAMVKKDAVSSLNICEFQI